MKPLERYEYVAPSMGTILKMVVYADQETLAHQAIDAGLTEIERLIPILNNYDPSSEVSRMVATVGQPIRLSTDLGQTLQHAHRWHELSHGAFDATVGPLTQVWSQSRRVGQLPSQESMNAARSRVGWHLVEWLDSTDDRDPSEKSFSVVFAKEGMRIDVSGLATGYIIDCAFEKMRASGIETMLIDIGGDIRVGEAPPGSTGWKVDVAGLGKEAPLLRQLRLRHCAITTSGDLNQFIEIDGVRYSHLIDPRAGEPVRRRQSVTAIAETAIDADAGATALCVLGMLESASRFEQFPLSEAIILEQDLSASRPSTVRYRHLMRQIP
jgi:thiamine biosynthesis lipoprotein